MSDAALIAALFVSLGATVVALGACLWLAHAHRVQAHIGAVGAFVALLLVTLFFAETLGGRYDFAAPAKPIHLGFATVTTVFLLAPLATGALHWRGKASRGLHVVVVRVFLALLVVTLGTGVWMFTVRTPRPAPAAAPRPAPALAPG